MSASMDDASMPSLSDVDVPYEFEVDLDVVLVRQQVGELRRDVVNEK